MAITNVGFDGTILETQWAQMSRDLGAQYAAMGAGDWKVTTVTGVDRTVAVAAGTVYGHGVRTTSDAQQTIQLPVIASGSRWDLVALRRDWQPPGGTATLVSVTGSSTKVVPAGRNANPGVLDDQPLALVQVTAGQSLPTAVLDLRVWPSKLLTANDLLAAPADLGTEVVVGAHRYLRVLDDSANLAWKLVSGGTQDGRRVHYERVGGSFNSSGIAYFPHSAGWAPTAIIPAARLGTSLVHVTPIAAYTASSSTIGLRAFKPDGTAFTGSLTEIDVLLIA